MKNKLIAALLAAGVLLTAASCSKETKETTHRESPPETAATESETTSTTTQEETTTVTTEYDEQPASSKEITDALDIESQLMLIGSSYDKLFYDYFGGGFVILDDDFSGGFIAVTDLNHNGRLEVLVTTCQGTEFYSVTKFYEVSEDGTALEKLMLNGMGRPDQNGDFSMTTEFGDHSALYACYLKDGEYHYLIQDYANEFWENKMLAYFSYSFGDDGVTRDIIGGGLFEAEEGDGIITINTSLINSSEELFDNEEDYFDYLDSFWSDYEVQPSCEIKWMAFDWQDADYGSDGFYDDVVESYEAFNPASDEVATVDYDFHNVIDDFYSENGSVEIKYVIRET